MKRLLAVLLFAFSLPAWSQDYPAKPIHIVVSVSAGGSIDTIARAYGEALEEHIERNPFSAVLVALGLGFLIGLMSRR